MSAIVVRELTKKFRRQLVFNDFNLEVFDGEIFSVMGLKGSGKTTLARILFNFYKPNKGSINILDMDAQRESKSIKEFTSYIPAEVWMYENLKPQALFKQTLYAHGLKNTDDIQSLMEYFEVDNKHKFIDLTDSERKRVAIVNALITKPKLLVIDEPTNNLSKPMVEKLFTHLKRLQSSEDLSVLMLTDDLSIGQRFADRGAYLSDGRLVGIEYLKEKKNNDKVLRIFDEVVSVAAFEDVGAELLKDQSGDIEFFYDGYLPTLTTVLHQQKIKNYTLEDALLEDKVEAFRNNGGRTVRSPEDPERQESATDDTITTEDTILAFDADQFREAEAEKDRAEADAGDPFDEANKVEDETVIIDEIAMDRAPEDVEEKDAEPAVDDAVELEAKEDSEPEVEEAVEAEVFEPVHTEATSKFVVHNAEDRTTVDSEPVQAYDANKEVPSSSDPYNSEGLIHDTRKIKPVRSADDYDVVEEKYSFNPGKEED
ncbi:MAG: ABC transporter ATP-binding protein [Peptoniphilus sp.]|nr:ABC transporter ATP-binding protein [Peptoniphilus sp.]MDD7362905.1 ABC transporter ATP-binding protein [Bacillota bacterium]MDY6044145.1 ABC transporter ATP-binding protein [Peptoniphilus sp.]